MNQTLTEEDGRRVVMRETSARHPSVLMVVKDHVIGYLIVEGPSRLGEL